MKKNYTLPNWESFVRYGAIGQKRPSSLTANLGAGYRYKFWPVSVPEWIQIDGYKGGFLLDLLFINTYMLICNSLMLGNAAKTALKQIRLSEYKSPGRGESKRHVI